MAVYPLPKGDGGLAKQYFDPKHRTLLRNHVAQLLGSSSEYVMLRPDRGKRHSAERAVHLLLVENDSRLVHRMLNAFAEREILNPVHVAKTGEEAMARLCGDVNNLRLPRPNIVVVDLDMPQLEGFKFLASMRHDPNLNDTVVFAVSKSESHADRLSAYGKHVAAYLPKAKFNEDFARLAELVDFYRHHVILPPSHARIQLRRRPEKKKAETEIISEAATQ